MKWRVIILKNIIRTIRISKIRTKFHTGNFFEILMVRCSGFQYWIDILAFSLIMLCKLAMLLHRRATFSLILWMWRVLTSSCGGLISLSTLILETCILLNPVRQSMYCFYTLPQMKYCTCSRMCWIRSLSGHSFYCAMKTKPNDWKLLMPSTRRYWILKNLGTRKPTLIDMSIANLPDKKFHFTFKLKFASCIAEKQ